MEGITILNTVTHGVSESNWMLLLMMGVIIVAVWFIECAVHGDFCAWGIPIIGVLIILGYIVAAINYIPYNTYQVTIDNSVNFTEFSNHYQIVDQDGQIYTIKERDN